MYVGSLVRWCVGSWVRSSLSTASPGADSTAVERVCVRACARVSTVRWFVGSWVRGFIQQQACQLFSAFQGKKMAILKKKNQRPEYTATVFSCSSTLHVLST